MSGTHLRLKDDGRTFDKTFTPVRPGGKLREPSTGLDVVSHSY